MHVVAGELDVRLLDPRARPPARTRAGDAGYDVCCLDGFTLRPGKRQTVGTGFALAIPAGWAGLVLPRSGLAANYGVTTLNAPGLIDPNYRGEVKVIVHNAGDDIFRAEPGDRIAQLLFVPFWTPEVALRDALPPSPDERGEHGFGSSGR